MASKEAEHIVESLLEGGINTGEYPDYIHPEKKTKFRQRSHPMARLPAYPEHNPQDQEAQNWEELLASEQYQQTLQRLSQFLNQNRPENQRRPLRQGDFPTIAQAMLQAIVQANEIEEPRKEQLEHLAIQLIFEQPEFRKMKEPYERGEFKIDAQLGAGNLERAEVSPENRGMDFDERGGEEDQDIEREEAAVDRLSDLNPELEKRKVITAMIHGGAVSKNYAYQLISQELNAIDPRLLNLYGIAMAGTELGYFATPDSHAAMAAKMPDLAGGSAEIDFEEENVPVIRARGMIFPMLIQELAKGLLELFSYEGLPQDAKAARSVLDKTDFVDQESWSMIMGRGLWMRFVNALGGDQDEITMHLYNRIVQMPPDQFNRTMQIIQQGGPKAQEALKRLAQDVRMDMEAQDRAEFEQSEGPGEQESGGEDNDRGF